jgi:hypothetical protein
MPARPRPPADDKSQAFSFPKTGPDKGKFSLRRIWSHRCRC